MSPIPRLPELEMPGETPKEHEPAAAPRTGTSSSQAEIIPENQDSELLSKLLENPTLWLRTDPDKLGEALGCDSDKAFNLIYAPERSRKIAEKIARQILTDGKVTQKTLNKAFGLSPQDAKKIIKKFEDAGLIGPAKPGKSRKILFSKWPPDNTSSNTQIDQLLSPFDREQTIEEQAASQSLPSLTTLAREEPATPQPATRTPLTPPAIQPLPPPLTTPARDVPATPPPATPPQLPPPPPLSPKTSHSPDTEIPPTSPDTSPTPNPDATSSTRDTEPATEYTQPTESLHWYERPRRAFADAAKRFLSRFRGETQPEQEANYKPNMADAAKNLATGFFSVFGSYTGVRILANLPAWLYQKYWTNPAERKRIQKALKEAEKREERPEESSALERKKTTLEQAINSSKFLTAEKKAALMIQLQDIVETYEKEEISLRAERDEKIAKLLDEAIETRVKNATVLKESLNSALMLMGLSAMRGAAYGAVALYERYKRVARERAEGKREGNQFKEWIINGFTETALNLAGGGARTWAGKGLNFVKGSTVVMRFLGFEHLAISELAEEGGPSAIIEASLKAFEEKGAIGAMASNAAAPWEHIISLFHGESGGIAAGEKAGHEDTAGDNANTHPDTHTSSVANTGAAHSRAPAEATADSTRETDISQAHMQTEPGVGFDNQAIETGKVIKGDGIIKILERQGVPREDALAAARAAGIVRDGTDTRLTTQAIGRLSILASTSPDGETTINFLDTQTGEQLSLDQIREAGFTYESGGAPVEIATPAAEIATHAPHIQAPEPEIFTDSPNVPNQLLDGTFILYTDDHGNFTSLDPGDGNIIERMREALKELKDTGYENSNEAEFIRRQMRSISSESLDQTVSDAMQNSDSTVQHPPTQTEHTGVNHTNKGQPRQEVSPEPTTGHGHLRRFRTEAGTVRFKYDHDGNVRSAFIRGYRPRKSDIDEALKEWGLSRDEVKDHFYRGSRVLNLEDEYIPTARPDAQFAGQIDPTGRDIAPDTRFRNFTRMVERLRRQEATLQEMNEQGLARTPEYAYWQNETDDLKTYVTEQMKKEFHITEQPF